MIAPWRRRRVLAMTQGVMAYGITPARYSGLQLWLDASQISGLSDGDPVATWTDLSGNSNNATQATGSLRPTYQTNEQAGKAGVLADGVDDTMIIPSLNGPTGQTVFLVFRLTANVGAGGIFIPLSTDGLEVTLVNIGGYRNVSAVYDASVVVDSSGFDNAGLIVSGAKAVLAVSYNGGAANNPASYRFWLDGVEQVSVLSGVFGGGSTSSLFTRATGVGPTAGFIFELADYNNQMSAADVVTLSLALKEKWGI